MNFAGDVDPSELDEWRRAPEDSQEYALVENYDRALGFLGVALQ